MKELTNDQRPSNRKKILAGLLFLSCAIPGLALLLICSGFLIGFFIDPTSSTPNPILSILGAVLGLLLILIGTGQLKNWAYSLVFLSMPVSLIVFALVIPASWIDILGPVIGGKLGPALIAGGAAFLTYRFVRSFYERKSNSHKQS